MPDVFSDLPKAIHIGPYIYRVIIFEKPPDENGHITFGLQSSAYLTLSFNLHVPNSIHAADTVIHEILHAIHGNTGLSDTAVACEEQTCAALATGLVQVFTDNPKLVTWLNKAVRNKKR